MSVHCQIELVVDKFFNYTSYLDLAYLKINSFCFHLCRKRTPCFPLGPSSPLVLSGSISHTQPTCCHCQKSSSRKDQMRYEAHLSQSSQFLSYLLCSPNCNRSHCHAKGLSVVSSKRINQISSTFVFCHIIPRINPIKLEQHLWFIISLLISWRLLLITRNTPNWVPLPSINVPDQVALSSVDNVFPPQRMKHFSVSRLCFMSTVPRLFATA